LLIEYSTKLMVYQFVAIAQNLQRRITLITPHILVRSFAIA
jgi:hypothetical protein